MVAVLWHNAKVGRGWGAFRMRTRVLPDGVRRARRLTPRPFAVIASLLVGLSLTACSKCDVPTWHHDSPVAPQSCRDGPAQ